MAPTRPRSDAGTNPHARARRRITPLTHEQTSHCPHAGTDGNALGQRGSTPPTRGDEPHRPRAETKPPPHAETSRTTHTRRHTPLPHTHEDEPHRTAQHRAAHHECPRQRDDGATASEPPLSRKTIPLSPGTFRSPPGRVPITPGGEFRSSPGDVPTVPGNVPTLDSHVSSSTPPLHAERCLTTRVTMRPPARTDPSARRGEPGMCPRGFPRAGPDRRSRTRATARKDPTVG